MSVLEKRYITRVPLSDWSKIKICSSRAVWALIYTSTRSPFSAEQVNS